MKTIFLLLTELFIALVLLARSPLAAEAFECDGVIEPYMVVNLGSSVAGVLATVDVERGDSVKAGQVVATLQSGVEQATMEVARARAEMEAGIKANQAQLDFSKRKKEREGELYQEKIVSFSEIDETETAIIVAEMELQEALENKRLAELEYQRTAEVVERMNIRSPIRGVVVERFLAPGERIEEEPVLKIAQIDPLNVEVILPVSQLPLIKVGMRAKVIPEAPVGGQYTAEVKIVDRVIDAASGTFGVRLQLPNSDHQLPAGLKCKVVFPTKQEQLVSEKN
jgi:RND family efflux transporter MFP subunit